jgi:hypothetical protein
MVSQDILDKLNKTVNQYLDEGRMFTGYDVTIETRTREKISLRHQDVRADIHELVSLKDAMSFGHDMPGGKTVAWKATQHDMPGGGWAFVYHPDTMDPSQYQPRNASYLAQATKTSTGHPSSNSPPPSLSISISDGTASDSGGQQDDGTFATDLRDRLLIPTRFIRDAGINAGDSCYVIADPQSKSILICKDEPKVQGLSFTLQKVERDGGLRLASRTLKLADLNDSKFLIEIGDQKCGSVTFRAVAVKNTVASGGNV